MRLTPREERQQQASPATVFRFNGPRQQSPEQAAKSAARSLPDDWFEDDPAVVALRQALQLRLQIEANALKYRLWLQQQRQRMKAEIDTAQQSLTWVAMADVSIQDEGFKGLQLAVERIEKSRMVLAVTGEVLEVLEKRQGGAGSIQSAVSIAEQRLSDYLFELKCAHYAAHGLERGL